jgi:hypothetical protein
MIVTRRVNYLYLKKARSKIGSPHVLAKAIARAAATNWKQTRPLNKAQQSVSRVANEIVGQLGSQMEQMFLRCNYGAVFGLCDLGSGSCHGHRQG